MTNEAELPDVWIDEPLQLADLVRVFAWSEPGNHKSVRYVPAARLDALREAANRIEGDDVLARLHSGNATPEDQYNAANSLAYLWAQDGLLSKAQQEVDQLRDQLAEVERPLDAQMARLNANLLAANRARMDAERELEAARADAERWQDRAEKCAVAMALFASAIKSGEPWTDECQRALDAARKERT